MKITDKISLLGVKHMNSKEAQNDLERMIAKSLESRLCGLGITEEDAQNALHLLDFDDIRLLLSCSDDELRFKFAYLY